jgi:hypothetical protein
MQMDGISPGAVAFTCVLAATADMASLTTGKQLHNEVKVVFSQDFYPYLNIL